MHEFELNKDVDEMEPEELRVTLADFMEKHEENVEDYHDLRETHESLEEEFSEVKDAADELRAKFAEEAAEYVNLDPEIIAERFKYHEIAQIVEEGQETDFSDDEEDEADEDVSFTTFSEREEKGKAESDERVTKRKRDDAKDHLKSVGFLKE